jgi:hypothetical protein
MDDKVTPLERAYELARSGKCRNLIELSIQLRSEGYSTAQIEGPLLKKQLRHLIDISTTSSTVKSR